MLTGLFGKKSDHPLANLKSAQQILEDVPKGDVLKALQELTNWFESLRDQADEFRPEHQVAVLRLLDEAAQPYVRKLLRDYFAVQSLGKFQENRALMVLSDFFILSEQSYAGILARCRKGDKGADAVKPQLALLAVRGLVAATSRLKLAAVRYAQVEPALWVHVAEIYAYAEGLGLLDEQVSLYPGTGTNTSVRREFAAAMVWYSVGTGSLSPLQIHIAERLLAYLNKYLTAGTEIAAGSQWAFDLAQPASPMRANAETTIHPSVRFIGMGNAENVFNDLLRSLEKGIVPQEINMGGVAYEAELVREVARQLLTRCILPSPTRRNARRKLKVDLHVANGFSKLIESACGGFDFSSESHEKWGVEDISATGFRGVIAPSSLDKITIGSLVGSKPENMESWGVGIVRRLSRDAQNNLHVGVETLANQVIGVALGATDRFGTDEDHLALYLNRQNDNNSGEAWLLMKPGTFASNRSFNVKVGDRPYLLLPLGLVESGGDYDLARYRKMEQDTSSD